MEDQELQDCVLCDGKILPQINPKDGKPFWWGGHNPRPLADKGACCDFCNTTKVIPARIMDTM
jgi:hypothetical protein